jgi:hypothetical protein
MGYLYPGVYFNRPNNLADLRERIHAVMEQISSAIMRAVYKIFTLVWMSAKCLAGGNFNLYVKFYC